MCCARAGRYGGREGRLVVSESSRPCDHDADRACVPAAVTVYRRRRYADLHVAGSDRRARELAGGNGRTGSGRGRARRGRLRVAVVCAVTGLFELFTSTDPAGGRTAWHSQPIDGGGGGLSGISCPSSDMCVAFDGNGNVLVSTDPDDGGTWQRANISRLVINALSCGSVSLCVAVTLGERVQPLVSRNTG